MTSMPWPAEEIRSFASIGTGAKDTKDRIASGKYPFFVRSQKVERIDSWSFEGEAVLTAGDGVGTGKVFHYIDGKFDYHQRVYRISNFRADVSGRYFFHQFSRNFLERILSLTAKSSVDSVRMETIAGMRIPLPQRAEQDRIVRAIDDADALIHSIEGLIAKKQAIRQGISQQLLTGETRLPGFTREWVETRLHSVLAFEVGFPFKSEFFSDTPTGLRLVRNRDLRATDSRTYYFGPFSESHIVRDGDVLVGMDGDFSPCNWRGGRALLNQRVGRIRATRCSSAFMYYALARPLAEIEAGTGATTVKHLSHADVESLTLVLPPLAEQDAIAGVLADSDAEIVALEDRLIKARAIKDGMLQQLLTGRTRLPVEVAS